MSRFTEVGDRVWVARYEWFDVNVTVVGSQRGLLVVDTNGSTAEGRLVADDIRKLGAGDVIAVVNTHWHFDHTFGNEAFRLACGDIPFIAHEAAADEFARSAEEARQWFAGAPEDPHSADVLATNFVRPTETFISTRTIDLGDRSVELVHPGRGHTAGDLLVQIPGADILLAGDVVEESGSPSYGPDSFPLSWPRELDVVLDLMTPDTVVVPGHGAPVGRDFVESQRDDVLRVACTIRDLAARGIPAEDALSAAAWPWKPSLLRDAVARGYAELARE